MEWENNYFQIMGDNRSLSLNQKNGGVVIVAQYLNQFLMIKIKRTDSRFHWEFPRGFVEKKELQVSPALRELKEELNIQNVKITKDLGEIMPDSGVINSHIHVFEVKINDIDDIRVQSSEHIVDYKLIDFRTLCEMIKQNEIIDGFTISGLFKWYLND